jgi:hypothetical protein
MRSVMVFEKFVAKTPRQHEAKLPDNDRGINHPDKASAHFRDRGEGENIPG